MAIVIRYFSTAAAGARDGTTWADRASLCNANVTVNSGTWSAAFTLGETATQTGTGATGIVEHAGGSGTVLSLSSVTGSPNNSGVWTGGTSGSTVTPTTTPTSGGWSVVITGFNFAGSDGLEVRIGPGTYTPTGSAFGVSPTAVNPIIVIACTNTGTPLEPPDRDWSSAQPVWDTSLMPLLDATIAYLVNQGNSYWKMIRFRTSGGNVLLVNAYFNWCYLESTSTGASVGGFNASSAVNCVVKFTGTSWNTALYNGGYNCRIEGNASANAGNRYGSTNNAQRCTFINCKGSGVYFNSGSAGCVAEQSVFVGCGIGVKYLGNTRKYVQRSVIVGSTTYGVDGLNTTIEDSRLRNNTSGDILDTGNEHSMGNDTSAGTDADEFVDAANGDYRIKYGSSLWGKGIGAGDGPATICG